ncbi:hypothetical protein JTB14_018707 [Gonioctena quinquepunctata]|nr:hypothetical protein JTB14_018707 [Gonioctena quinquepunctata]
MKKAMMYGKNMEKLERELFERLIGAEVHEIGLIVSRHQPLLVCSPDGVISNGSDFELLEIKCPPTCENAKITNREEQTAYVSYLCYDKIGNLKLQESHAYYTQIQVSLYVIFSVFSEIDYLYLKIQRDGNLLSSIIHKIEFFYFEYFYALLTRSLNRD